MSGSVADRNPLFGTDWDSLLRQEFTESYWAELQVFVENERSHFPVYPPHDEVFKAFKFDAALRD
jgi:uracil DNA glycosylase